MKWLLVFAAVAVVALADEARADRWYRDQYGRMVQVVERPQVRRAPQYSRMTHGRLRYVQSCPDGNCGGGFSGDAPAGLSGPSGDGAVSDQGDTFFATPKRR